METLIFDNATVKAHPIYPDCGASLHDVSKRDYPSDDFFDECIECLDVDGYETLVCKKHRKTKQPTADAVIGVRSHLGGGQFSKPELMVVELRMKYQSPKNLDGQNLSDKIFHTKELLGCDAVCHKTSYFVFKDSVIEAVTGRFWSLKMEHKELRHSEAVSTSGFDTLVKGRESYPYQPKTDLDAMKKQLSGLADAGELEKFVDQIDFWIDKARWYKKGTTLASILASSEHCAMHGVHSVPARG